MTAHDAPQVEPLTLTLEDALRIAMDADMRVTFDGTSVTIEDSFGDEIAYVEEWNWPKAFSEAFMEPVTPRDDTAELVEALAEPLRYFLEWREEIESDLGIWASKSQTREAFDQAEAALARVKGER